MFLTVVLGLAAAVELTPGDFGKEGKARRARYTVVGTEGGGKALGEVEAAGEEHNVLAGYMDCRKAGAWCTKEGLHAGVFRIYAGTVHIDTFKGSTHPSGTDLIIWVTTVTRLPLTSHLPLVTRARHHLHNFHAHVGHTTLAYGILSAMLLPPTLIILYIVYSVTRIALGVDDSPTERKMKRL